MNRINSSYIFNLTCHYISSSKRQEDTNTSWPIVCTNQVTSKNFKVKKKKTTNTFLFEFTILACRLPSGFWVPQMVMLHKLHTSFHVFFSPDVERLNKKYLGKGRSRSISAPILYWTRVDRLAIVNPFQFQLCPVTDF